MIDGFIYYAHFLPVVAMLALVIYNQGYSRYRQEAKTERDGLRLRIALRAELVALLEVYETNLRSIADGTTLLMSPRAAAAIYRGNIQKLVLLPDAEIAPIVIAFAWNDAAEALLAAAGRHHPPPQRAENERAALAAIKAHHLGGIERIRTALAALAAGAAEPVAAGVWGRHEERRALAVGSGD